MHKNSPSWRERKSDYFTHKYMSEKLEALSLIWHN